MTGNNPGLLLTTVEELLRSKGRWSVIDARPRKNYERSHIPGAVNIDFYTYHWADTDPVALEAFTRHTAKLFAWAGVREDVPVVFYDSTSGMYAARGLWLLRYLGHKRASMLDGGIRGWIRKGLPTESGSVPPIPSSFSPRVRKELIATKDYVVKRLHDPSVQFLDCREPREWLGKLVRGARGGRIPGALTKDYRRNLSRDGRFKNLNKLKEMYTELGIRGDKEVVTYCQGGYRAANSFVALSLLGYRARVYLGSWSEWANEPGTPVER